MEWIFQHPWWPHQHHALGFSFSQPARDLGSCAQPFELFLHMQKVVTRPTTSSSTSKVSTRVCVQVFRWNSWWHHLLCTSRRQPWQKWHITLPQKMLEQTVQWLHRVMGHTGDGFVKHCSNVIITPSSDTPLTKSSVSIAKDTNCQEKAMDCLNGKCE